jgi:hypothetical protein
MHLNIERNQVIGASAAIIALLVLWIFRDYLSGIAAMLWPIVVGSALLVFRQELSRLIGRMKRFGPTGAEFSDASIAAQSSAVPIEQAIAILAPAGDRSPEYLRRLEALKMELNARVPSGQTADRELLLEYSLAVVLCERDFLLVWLNIFLSQLEALSTMLGVSGPIDLKPFYEAHVRRRNTINPEPAGLAPPPSFEGWVSFMGRMQLVEINGLSGQITEFGRLFMRYSADRNLPRFHIL